METTLSIVSWAAAAVTAACLYYIFSRRYQLAVPEAGSISISELGVFERDLKNLRLVIVIADQIEKPTNTLAEAVENNFAEGVKYLFLVSKSKADDALHGYYLIFEALAKIVAKRSRRQVPVHDLVEIQRLPYDWEDYPYIFYQCWSDEDTDRRVTYAFRGNQLREGIAETYASVPPRSAASIARAVLAGAPSALTGPRVSVGEFEGTSNPLRLVR